MTESLSKLRAMDDWLGKWMDGEASGDSPDPDLARRLLDRLDLHSGALDCPPLADPEWVSGVAASLAYTGQIRPGARVGVYEIGHALGAGGMGAVYLARRKEGGFEQTVEIGRAHV